MTSAQMVPPSMTTSSSSIGEFDRANYQHAARTVLKHPLITTTFPTTDALPLVRRWAGPLAEDLWDQLGYRLEITATTARLIRVHDELDGTRPAVTRTGREFDRRRYAYLVLTLAVLDRAGTQVSLSELANRVAGEAAQVDGLELAADRAADRAGFVDAVGWLEERGALTVADGSARGWADNPDSGEALYDIDREAVRAIYRPSQVLQHVGSITELLAESERLARPDTVSRNTIRRQAGQRVRRALVEQPVVYYDELDPSLHGMLRSPRTTEDLSELTGAAVERRADGALLLDVVNALTDTRFPGPGTVTQAALLLLVAIADRIEDVDAPQLATFPLPEPVSRRLATELDAALPVSSTFHIETEQPNGGYDRRAARDYRAAAQVDDARRPTEHDDTGEGDGYDSNDNYDDYDETLENDEALSNDETLARPISGRGSHHDRQYPFLQDAWLRDAMGDLIGQYGKAFAVKWLADPESLLREVLTLLAQLKMVRRTAGGVLALPLLARYRNAVVDIRGRNAAADDMGLFGA